MVPQQSHWDRKQIAGCNIFNSIGGVEDCWYINIIELYYVIIYMCKYSNYMDMLKNVIKVILNHQKHFEISCLCENCQLHALK